MRTSIGRSYSTKGMRAGQRLARFGAASLVVMMLAMALLPFTSTGVLAADDDDLKISENLIVNTDLIDTDAIDDVVVDPVMTPTPEPEIDDLVDVEVDPDLIDDVVVDPIVPGTIQVAKFGCDDDYEGDYYQLAQNCEPMNADFGVYYTSGEQFFNGSFTAENVAPGEVTVAETIPGGYGEPFVFCDSYDALGNSTGFAAVQTAQGALYTAIESGEYLYCDWFNIPVDTDGMITIKKWECPEDLAFVVEAGWEDYLTACTTTMNDVEFDLDYLDESLTDLSGYTGDSGDGTLVFNGIKQGSIELREEIPAGYGDPVVFCGWGAIYDEDGDGIAIAVDGVAGGGVLPGGVLGHEMLPAETLYCDWFNFPHHDDNVVIYKWYCEESFDAYGASLDELLQYCTQAMSGIDFSLYGEGENFVGDATTDDSGYVGFAGVGAGHYALNESVPSGYGEPIVYCDRPDYGFEHWPVHGFAAIEFDLYEGGWIACHWFNIPDDDDITIIKWECPEGFDAYNATLDELWWNCTQAMSGIDFSLYGDFENFIGTETTDDTGTATYSGLEPGTYALNESLPSGYGQPVVYCEQLDAGYENYPVYGYGSIQFEHDGGWIVCHWFNVPDHGGSIVIHKYTCPPGYDLEAWGADPKADCWEKTNGVGFSLYGDGYSDEGAVTGDFIPGAVAWGGLDYGDYTVVEDVPAGTVATFVICQWEEELGPFIYDTFYPYSNGDSAVGNRIDLELYEGTNIVCHWYNIPEDHDGGELIVIKYWCDGAIYDEAHCELYGGGANFSVEESSGFGDPYYFTTGWDGTAQLFLDAGTYTLIETDRAWCKAKSDQVDSDGNVVVYEDQTSYVTVFNCGPGKKDDTPVKKFPNTGVGEGVSDGGYGTTGSMGLLLSFGMVGALTALRTSRPQLARTANRQDWNR